MGVVLEGHLHHGSLPAQLCLKSLFREDSIFLNCGFTVLSRFFSIRHFISILWAETVVPDLINRLLRAALEGATCWLIPWVYPRAQVFWPIQQPDLHIVLFPTYSFSSHLETIMKKNLQKFCVGGKCFVFLDKFFQCLEYPIVSVLGSSINLRLS